MLAAALLVAAAATAGGAKPVPVFTWGESGYSVFREPAILMLPTTGTLLALIEGGANHLLGGGGAGAGYPNSNSDVVAKLSSDGGRTWGKLIVVLKNASQPGAVWDSTHQKVVLNLNGAPHCLGAAAARDMGAGGADSCGFNLQMASTDGLAWSAPVALDGFLGRQGHAANGHAGLELTAPGTPHKGRLLFIGHRGAYVEDAVWFTDDGGASYKTSAHTLPGMDEAQVQLNDTPTHPPHHHHHSTPPLLPSSHLTTPSLHPVPPPLLPAGAEPQRHRHREHAVARLAGQGPRHRDIV